MQRIRYIMVLMREYKSRADGIVKGQTMHTTVGAPQEMLHQARQNGKNNKQKAQQIKVGRESLGKRSKYVPVMAFPDTNPFQLETMTTAMRHNLRWYKTR